MREHGAQINWPLSADVHCGHVSCNVIKLGLMESSDKYCLKVYYFFIDQILKIISKVSCLHYHIFSRQTLLGIRAHKYEY